MFFFGEVGKRDSNSSAGLTNEYFMQNILFFLQLLSNLCLFTKRRKEAEKEEVERHNFCLSLWILQCSGDRMLLINIFKAVFDPGNQGELEQG